MNISAFLLAVHVVSCDNGGKLNKENTEVVNITQRETGKKRENGDERMDFLDFMLLRHVL